MGWFGLIWFKGLIPSLFRGGKEREKRRGSKKSKKIKKIKKPIFKDKNHFTARQERREVFPFPHPFLLSLSLLKVSHYSYSPRIPPSTPPYFSTTLVTKMVTSPAKIPDINAVCQTSNILIRLGLIVKMGRIGLDEFVKDFVLTPCETPFFGGGKERKEIGLPWKGVRRWWERRWSRWVEGR